MSYVVLTRRAQTTLWPPKHVPELSQLEPASDRRSIDCVLTYRASILERVLPFGAVLSFRDHTVYCLAKHVLQRRQARQHCRLQLS